MAPKMASGTHAMPSVGEDPARAGTAEETADAGAFAGTVVESTSPTMTSPDMPGWM
jgi:hypothetical protein